MTTIRDDEGGTTGPMDTGTALNAIVGLRNTHLVAVHTRMATEMNDRRWSRLRREIAEHRIATDAATREIVPGATSEDEREGSMADPSEGPEVAGMRAASLIQAKAMRDCSALLTEMTFRNWEETGRRISTLVEKARFDASEALYVPPAFGSWTSGR